MEKQKEKKVLLKVSPSHPAKRFYLGRHKIGQAFEEFKLNEDELKELEGAGPKKWLVVGESKKKAKAE